MWSENMMICGKKKAGFGKNAKLFIVPTIQCNCYKIVWWICDIMVVWVLAYSFSLLSGDDAISLAVQFVSNQEKLCFFWGILKENTQSRVELNTPADRKTTICSWATSKKRPFLSVCLPCRSFSSTWAGRQRSPALWCHTLALFPWHFYSMLTWCC